ncbi:MAG: response regulator transcription factor [Anaerolineales bacterium]|nr:MAG: response regulator transcription factor [Anaerolineales bacterium]
MLKLLLVDDHAVFREGIGVLLEMEDDMQVVGEASRGEEALRLAAELQPDVVLLDIAMPDMDGIEICQRLKRSLPNTAVLVLSAFDTEETVMAALTAGASGYVVKTIDHQRLVEGIRAIARGEMLLSPTVAAKVVQQLARTRQEKEREADALQALTPREREVFHLVARGCTNAEIAERLVLSEKTVKTHVRNISNKLNLSGKAEMRVLAAQLGLVPPE